MQNLSKTQKVRLLKLNLRLENLQEKIIKEAVKLDIELSKRVADETDILDDYEIDLKIHFILRKDDENYKEDDDNFVTEIKEYLKGISKKSDSYPWSLEEIIMNIGHGKIILCKINIIVGGFTVFMTIII